MKRFRYEDPFKVNRYMFKHKKRFAILFFFIFVAYVGLNIYYSTLVQSEKTVPVVIQTWWSSFSWTWSIRNFSAIPEENGYEMKSPQFSTERHPNLKWYLSLYPYGDAEDSNDFMGLFLHFASGTEDVVHARCSLSISNLVGRVLNIQSFDHGFSSRSHRYGYARFLQTKNLLNGVNVSGVVEVRVDLSIKTNGTEREYKAEQDQCFGQNSFMQDFSTFQNKQELSDITIISNNGREFYGHRAILAARSSVFRQKITQNATSPMTLDYDDSTVRLLLDAIYGDEIRFSWLSDTDAMKLLKAAQEYKLNDLKESCGAYLDTIMDLSNVADILLLADECNASILKSNAIAFIHTNFRKFIGEYFKSVDSRNKKRLNELLRQIVEHGL